MRWHHMLGKITLPYIKRERGTNMNKYLDRCVNEYRKIVENNPKIDAGHSVNHVKKVEDLTRRALQEFLGMDSNHESIQMWLMDHPRESLEVSVDVTLRVAIASLLHEVGDAKTVLDGAVRPKAEIISEVLNRVMADYPSYSDEMRLDIINMIDLCSASKWGDRIPDGTKLYQLLPRWADRQEATGVIGIVRCLTYSYVKRNKGYPLCQNGDHFPTTQKELERVAPYSRWVAYSNGVNSVSGWEHLQDKIRHINGSDVPIPCLKKVLNDGQAFVDRFILDFTNVYGKKFDMNWIIERVDPIIYNVEIKQLREMQTVLRNENCQWIR